ncbi:ABC transporter ATP-binding protein/permease [Halobacteria archaeon AArc-m2/3/4]|uniref:ABC transporter ATP-binding protein/permease n=1 Tax=Natronoglomus mannanivorans TaxID=2979990 RepID=A0AAP2Z3U2_9EURY|nr:ABC transporter ATP-binding protein/permease [Halobacteria archaeon AArc-xg1-1]MCU4975555.1 ABC transporter ATP-binding protein/permease [Halobacteria archaeon AArc-m2/3/4]
MSTEPTPDSTVLDEYRDEVSRPILRLFTQYGRPQLHWFTIGVITSTLARFLGLVPPIILGIAIDSVFNDDEAYSLPLVPDGWIPGTESGQFWLSVGLMGGAMVLAAIMHFFRMSTLNLFSHRVKHEVRTDTYRTMQRLDMDFFNQMQTGQLMSILNNDTNRLELFLDNMTDSAIQLAVLVVGIGGVLFWMNWQLAFVTLFVIPVAALFTYWFMSLVEEMYVDIRQTVGDLNSRLENNLGGIEVIKSATTEEYEGERVEDSSYEYFRQHWRALRMNFVYRPGLQILTSIAFVSTFVVGGIWVVSGPPGPFTGTLSVGELVTFLLLTQQLVDPLAQMSEVIDRYEDAKASSSRIFALMSIPVTIKSDPDAADLGNVEGRVEYDDVTFAYGDDEPVLHDIDFDVDPGQTVGLVGPTGAGKTTILKLLLRLYDVSDGEVRVDGHDVRDVTLDSLRDQIGYVSQSPFLFDGTVEENITYGAFDASDEEIERAAKRAEAHDFISKMPEGYDTRVGERGVMLSGGQRQRICIARTILNDPAILIFDEATSAVDTETEMLIQRSLDDLTEDRTTFIIAHRLSTVRKADEILVVEDGRIVERGDHDDLLAEDGLYANLWSVQAGEMDALDADFIEQASQRAAMGVQDED